MAKIVLFANTDWYLYNFRLSLAGALRDVGHEIVMVSPPGDYGPKLQALGFRWLALPMDRRSLNPLRELSVVRWFTNFLRKERPDLVHGFTIKCAIYGAIASKLASVPARINAVAGMGYVFTSSDVLAKILRPLVSQLMRFALNGANSLLILQNPDDVAFFTRERLVERQRIRLIKGSGVNCDRFTVPARLAHIGETQENAQPLNVLLAARLLWDKGVAEFIEAATIVHSQGLPVKFFLAGTADDGNPSAVSHTLVHQWVAEGKVEWLGHVDDMPSVLTQMDVMALPSYREGLPKTLIEAAACGLALLTTDAPGCREVVSEDGVDGLIVPVRNGPALAEAIKRLAGDRGLCRRLGRAARLKVLDEFEERIVIRRTLEAYHELLRV
ncbi:glycosyltransferase family 4 protein [Paraburkholderia domus]|uniref:glycosyltransferase family 4 protein n=1 Tax=Paraburkholderia domus TaxID=2793075 RepID=UPI001912D63E|nr:glycosyltransferase family 4 protein [Paraburkholderia domus]MBK5065933.1 glycosyltransferase family 4 protein [Burkholderia sp. R-70199]CAE6964409.1 N, N'-diacetylbacillosaminyl-diphospho-undecaprenol alpha-1,3-N-acetylgalactosaminyltransferase [Paraburkholderia domus]